MNSAYSCIVRGKQLTPAEVVFNYVFNILSTDHIEAARALKRRVVLKLDKDYDQGIEGSLAHRYPLIGVFVPTPKFLHDFDFAFYDAFKEFKKGPLVGYRLRVVYNDIIFGSPQVVFLIQEVPS